MKKGFTLIQSGILLTLWLTFLLSFVMRLSWSSLMPIVNEALHFTAQQGTSYLTAFYFGYALTVLPGGLLADRFGYRKSILGSLVAMAIVTGLMSTVHSYEYGLVLRFLLGIVSGPVQSACLKAIGEHFSAEQRGTAVGIFMSCTSFGITVVNGYAPFVAVHYGWQMAFLMTALLPLIVFFLALFTVKEVQAFRVNHTVDTQGTAQQSMSLAQSLRFVGTNRNIVLLAVMGFFATGTTWGVTAWANLYLVKQLHVTPIFAGAIMSIYGIAAVVAKPTIGFISDRISLPRNYLAAIVMFLFSPALLIFANTSNPDMLYITAPLLGMGAFMYSPLTNAIIIQVAPPELRGTTAGFVNLFNQIGALTAPIILSTVLTATGNYQTALMALSISPIIGAILLSLIRLK